MEQSSGATSGAASSSDGAASACVRSDAPHAQPIVCENQGKVGEVRYSLNHRFAAVQRSETTVELLDLLLHNSFELAARGAGAKARWRILGFRWTGTPVSDFVVVTSAGVELYLVLPERKSVRLVKTIATDVSWYVYSHETRLFLLASGAQDNSLLGLQVQPQTVVKMPRFEVQLAPVSAALGQPAGQQRLRPSLQPSQLAVVRLYDSLFAAHVEPERQTLSLYQLFKDFVVRKHTLQVYSSQVSVSVSDNLLLVHALDSRVVLLFDIKINTQFPVTAPLPLSTAPSDGFSASYAAHWVFAAPDLVIDPVAGRVGQLCVDLYALARSSLDKFCLLQFLLARSNAQGVILEVLRCAIDEQESLPVLSRMFELLCAVEAQRKEAQSPTPVQRGAPRPRAGSARAASVIFQHGAGEAANASYRAGGAYGDSFRAVAPVGALESCESATRITSSSPPPWIEGLSDDADYDSAPPTGAMIGKYVLRPAVDAVMSTQPPSDARCVRRRFVVAALTELLFCMQQHALPPDEDVVSMLVEMLVSQGTVFQLLQLIECGVVPESAATVAQATASMPEEQVWQAYTLSPSS